MLDHHKSTDLHEKRVNQDELLLNKVTQDLKITSSIVYTVDSNEFTILESCPIDQIVSILLSSFKPGSPVESSKLREQPRISVTSLYPEYYANKLKDRYKEFVGDESPSIGYTLPFEDYSDSQTSVKFLSNAMVVREAMADPLLRHYEFIIIDLLFSTRDKWADILVCILLRIVKKRATDLRVIILSKPGDTKSWKDTLLKNNVQAEAVSLKSSSDLIKSVDFLYLDAPTSDYIEETVSTIINIHSKEPDGNIIAYVSTKTEVKQVIKQINDQVHNNSLRLIPFYSGLSKDDQGLVENPHYFGLFDKGKAVRIIIVTTPFIDSIAVDIPGVKYIVDIGLTRATFFNPGSESTSTITVPVPPSTSLARISRITELPGKCFRLYPVDVSPSSTIPHEFQRSNLTDVVLSLLSFGINPVSFQYISRPPSGIMTNALSSLLSLEAIDSYGKLTKSGQIMADLLPGVSPLLANAILVGIKSSCAEQMISIVCMVLVGGIDGVFYTPFNDYQGKREAKAAHAQFQVSEGDYLTLLNVYNSAYPDHSGSASRTGTSKWAKARYLNYQSLLRASRISAQIKSILSRHKISVGSNPLEPITSDSIRKAIMNAFMMHAAHRIGYDSELKMNIYELLRPNGPTVYSHHGSCIGESEKWIVFEDMLEDSDGRLIIRGVTSVKREWLLK